MVRSGEVTVTPSNARDLVLGEDVLPESHAVAGPHDGDVPTTSSTIAFRGAQSAPRMSAAA